MGQIVDRPKFSCALGGAIATLNALPRTVPILHSAPGCGLNLSYAINGGSGYMGSGYCGGTALSSSNICEKEIVFGGEDRLTEQIEKTIELIDGDLYFVVSGCMVEMIGDDITATARSIPVEGAVLLAAQTGGFKGNAYKGYDLVLQALFKEYVTIREDKSPTIVNLWGLVPAHDVFWQGNLRHLKKLLSRLGIKANTFFGEDETLEDLKNCGNASLNIVLSDTYGIGAAETFREVHGTPYITLSLPIGAHSTDRFIDQVADALSLEAEVSDRVKADGKKSYYNYLVRLSDLYNDYDLQRHAIIVGDANYTPALSRFVADDLGWLPELAIITDPLLENEKEKVLKRFDETVTGLKPEIVFNPDASAILPQIRRHWPADRNEPYYENLSSAVLLGSSFEWDLALDINTPILCVCYPVTNRVVLNRGYACYAGALSLVEDLLSALVSLR